MVGLAYFAGTVSSDVPAYMYLSTSSGAGSVAFGGALARPWRCARQRPLDLGQAVLVEDLVLDELATQVLDGIDGLPGLFLLLGAVLVARVGEGVAVVAVGGGLDEHRALAAAAELGGAGDRVADREHVHAVDDLGVHAVLGEAGATHGQGLACP